MKYKRIILTQFPREAIFLALVYSCVTSIISVNVCTCCAAISIKESAHVGDKNAKRVARGVDDLGKLCFWEMGKGWSAWFDWLCDAAVLNDDVSDGGGDTK